MPLPSMTKPCAVRTSYSSLLRQTTHPYNIDDGNRRNYTDRYASPENTIQEKSIRPAPYEKFPISPDIQSGLIFLTTDRRLSRPCPHSLKISFQTSSNEIVPIFQPIKTHNKLKKTKTFANTEYFIYFFPTKEKTTSLLHERKHLSRKRFFKTGLVSAEN